jgi:hypothetical protein
MKILKFFLLFIFLLNLLEALPQKEKKCMDLLSSDFITDGQHYTLTLNNSNTARIFLSFFEGFQYRLVICNNDIRNYTLCLYDIEKKLLFSGSCDNFTNSWDFSFKSTIACVVEIKAEKVEKPEITFNIVLGFKELQPKTDSKLKKKK